MDDFCIAMIVLTWLSSTIVALIVGWQWGWDEALKPHWDNGQGYPRANVKKVWTAEWRQP